jgi:hypothetical protein
VSVLPVRCALSEENAMNCLSQNIPTSGIANISSRPVCAPLLVEAEAEAVSMGVAE